MAVENTCPPITADSNSNKRAEVIYQCSDVEPVIEPRRRRIERKMSGRAGGVDTFFVHELGVFRDFKGLEDSGFKPLKF